MPCGLWSLTPSFFSTARLGHCLLHHAGRNEEARVQLEKTFELDPNFWIAHLTLGKVYTQERKYPEAIAEFEKAKELSRGNSEAIASIGYVAALASDNAKARVVLDELKTLSNQHYIPPVNIALVYNGLGDQGRGPRPAGEGLR